MSGIFEKLLPKGITRRKRAGYDESKKVSRTLLIGRRLSTTGITTSTKRTMREEGTSK